MQEQIKRDGIRGIKQKVIETEEEAFSFIEAELK